MRNRAIRIYLIAHLAVAGGAAWGAQPTAEGKQTLPTFAHPREITHPYLPLASLKQDIYRGKIGATTLRVDRIARPDLQKSFRVAGRIVPALVTEFRAYDGGKLTEAGVEYFAQGDDGAVYQLGQAVDQYRNDQVVGHAGSWLLGVNTRTPILVLPAKPKVGDKFQPAGGTKAAHEEDEVVSLSEKVTVPAGTFADCVKIKAALAGGKVEYRYYATGVGCVKKTWEQGELLLNSRTAPLASQNGAANPAAPGAGGGKPPPDDPVARVALRFVGADPLAEQYWMGAINDPRLSDPERQDLIEDLNEDGLSDPRHPGIQDLPLILNRIQIVENLAPYAKDQTNFKAFLEAYKDLTTMARDLLAPGRGR